MGLNTEQRRFFDAVREYLAGEAEAMQDPETVHFLEMMHGPGSVTTNPRTTHK